MAATRTRFIILYVALAALSTSAAAQRGPAPDQRTALLVGQVIDGSNGRPVAGAVVSLQGGGFAVRMSPDAGGPPPRILTGADGRFVFRDLPGGTFSITASRPGWADGAYGRVRAGGSTQQLRIAAGGRVGDVVIRMWKLGAITGRVTDEAGEPVVGLQVRAFRRMLVGGNRRFAGGTTALTDDRGIYRVSNLVPGEYLVAVVARSVSVPVSRLTQAPLDPPVGPPPPGFAPQMQGSAFALRMRDALVDSGRGGVTPPPPSGGRSFTYPLTFYPFGAAAAQAEAIGVNAGEERIAIDLQIRPVPTVRVAGTVVGPDLLTRLITLRLVPSSASDVAMEQDVAAAVTDESGAFEFPAVPEGGYELRGQQAYPRARRGAPENPIWWVALPVHAGPDDIVGLTVPLQPGLRVSGRVEFDGARAAASRVNEIPLVIERADGTPAQGLSGGTLVDASGTFVSTAVAPGRYIVRITGSPVGWMFKSAMFDGRDISVDPIELRGADATGVVITFTDRWTGVQGFVQDRRGAPDPHATVVAFPTHQSAWTDYGPSPRRLRSVRTGNDGTYAITSLPPGDYYVAALPDEQSNDWQDPRVLGELARGAAHIVITDGTKPTQNLRTRVLGPERSR